MEDDLEGAAHPVFAKVLEHANSLLETALTCQTGVRSIASLKVTKNNRTREERARKDVIRWATQERWLQSELGHYSSIIERKKTILSAREEAIQQQQPQQSGGITTKMRRDVATEEEGLQQSIAELQDELFRIVDENMRKELLLQQMHYSSISLQCVYPAENEKDGDDTTSTKSTIPEAERREIELLLRQRDDKSLEMAALHKKLQEVMDQCEALQDKNRAQRRRNQQLWSELKQLQGEMDGKNEEREKEKEKEKEKGVEGSSSSRGSTMSKNAEALERKLSMNVVIREAFQALIMESGINWAKDEKLRRLMLSLDTSLPPPTMKVHS